MTSARGWKPYHLHLPIVLKSGSLILLEHSGPIQVCTGTALPLLCAFFWVITRRLEFICRRFGTICLFHLHRQVDVDVPAYEDGTECSETSAHKFQTPSNYPKESTQHTEQGESLKSRMPYLCLRSSFLWLWWVDMRAVRDKAWPKFSLRYLGCRRLRWSSG